MVRIIWLATSDLRDVAAGCGFAAGSVLESDMISFMESLVLSKVLSYLLLGECPTFALAEVS